MVDSMKQIFLLKPEVLTPNRNGFMAKKRKWHLKAGSTVYIVGVYVVRTSSLNDKHSCQLFGMGLRDKTTPTLTTPLIRSNMSCAG